MQIKTFYGKFIGGTIILLLIGVTLPSPTTVQAATTAEIQVQIQSLLTQIIALQNQLSSMMGGTSSCSAPMSDLAFGSRGNNVTSLQNFLISRGYSIPAGATGYFGNQTQNALRLFQLNQGISPALGYTYGSLTRARIQALCTPAPSPAPQPPPEPSLSGEASLERFTVNDGDDTDLEEGDKNAEIMKVSFRVRDGDAELNRLEIGFTPYVANDEDDPWDTFDRVSVWNGSKRLAMVDTADKDEWREDSPHNGDYTIRLSGLDWLMQEDDEIDLTIKVDIQNNVRGTNDGESWTVFIPDNGLRAIDADNAPLYTGDTADAITLNLDRAGASDELIIRRSDDDPDASVIQLDDNRNSGYIEVFAFDLDTDDSRNDIEIYELPIQLTMSTGTLDTFIRSARLVVNSDTYTNETVTGSSTGHITFDFDRNDFVIDAGDRITAILEIDFNSLANVHEGTTIVARLDADDIGAEGRDDLIGNQLQGVASSETHVLYTKGSSVADIDTEAKVTSITGAINDYATFEVTVDLTAFGQDVYIPIGTGGVTYEIQNSSGTSIGMTGSAVVSSSARERSGYFFIPEGETDSLTLQVIYQPGTPMATARLQLLSISFNDIAAAPDQSWSAVPSSSYRTQTVVIVD